MNQRKIYKLNTSNDLNGLQFVPLFELNGFISCYIIEINEILDIQNLFFKHAIEIRILTNKEYQQFRNLSDLLLEINTTKKKIERLGEDFGTLNALLNNMRDDYEESVEKIKDKFSVTIELEQKGIYSVSHNDFDLLILPQILKFQKFGIIQFKDETLEILFAPEELLPKSLSGLKEAITTYNAKNLTTTTNAKPESFIDYLRIVSMFLNYTTNEKDLKEALALYTNARQINEATKINYFEELINPLSEDMRESKQLFTEELSDLI